MDGLLLTADEDLRAVLVRAVEESRLDGMLDFDPSSPMKLFRFVVVRLSNVDDDGVACLLDCVAFLFVADEGV